MTNKNFILKYSDPILVTGSNGFIGSHVVETLLSYGFKKIRCLVRPSSSLAALERIQVTAGTGSIEIIKGNLNSRHDCESLANQISLIYHLAAGRGDKSYPDAYMNSVVTTRNLLDAVLRNRALKRFVNVSSIAVYSNWNIPHGGLLDESCELECQPHLRGEAYCYAKVRQEELVTEYGRRYNIPYVTVRPGVVYGPGKRSISGRIGINTFGIYLHLGGSNRIPLSYVDNCAEAIVLAGLRPGVDGEAFNVVDNDLPTSRSFLRQYKKNVSCFKSVYLPRPISYAFCYAWEKYSSWSDGQLPPSFNRKKWSNYWKGNQYSNQKIKNLLGWMPRVGFKEAALRYFKYQREATD